MRNEKNICQYCMRQRVITTLSLNAVEIKCSKSYLTCLLVASSLTNMIFNANLVETKTASINFTLTGYISICKFVDYSVLTYFTPNLDSMEPSK